MSLIIWGLILWVAGKIAKVNALETIGKILMAVGVVIWGLGFIGIHLPLPV